MKPFITVALILVLVSKVVSQTTIQLVSSKLHPYPFESKIMEVADSFHVETVTINSSTYYRYLIKCETILETNQRLVLARERFRDAFIVVYYESGKRFN